MIIQNPVNTEIIDFFLENQESISGLLIATVILLIVNILTILIKLIIERNLKSVDYKNQRKSIYLENSLQIQLEAYKRLELLRGYIQANESKEYLLRIQEARKYINQHKPFLTKEIEKISTDFLDYLTTVIQDIRLKDIKKENEFLNSYCSLFRE